MQWLSRTFLNAALTIAPFVGCGCASPLLQSRQEAPNAQLDPQKEIAQQMLAAKREELRGNLVEARKLYTRLHQSHPEHAESAHQLALLYVKLNLLSEADVYYRKALAVTPNDSTLLADMGYLTFLRKEYAQAEEFLVRATNVDSTNRSAMHNLAVVRAWMGDDDESLATFRNLSDDANALRNLATVQIARGDKTLAVKTFGLAQQAQSGVEMVAASGETKSVNTALANTTSVDSNELPRLSEVPVELKVGAMPPAVLRTELSNIPFSPIPPVPGADLSVAPPAPVQTTSGVVVEMEMCPCPEPSTGPRPPILLPPVPRMTNDVSYVNSPTRGRDNRQRPTESPTPQPVKIEETLHFELPVRSSLKSDQDDDCLSWRELKSFEATTERRTP